MSSVILLLSILSQFILSQSTVYASSIGNRDNRYSFSLTTFSPKGHLQQVEYATLAAASLGDTPVLAAIINNFKNEGEAKILFCSLQNLPSPLIKDNGTPRFVNVCPGIAMAHSGLNADGRVLLAAAQRLAIEHEYNYDEDIPISIFLEELSLLFQKYTMKPGSRPFGCSLIIGDCTSSDGIPVLYRMGPSGVVERFDMKLNSSSSGVVMILGLGKKEKIVRAFLEEHGLWQGDKAENDAMDIMMNSILDHRKYDENSQLSSTQTEKKSKVSQSFITASMGNKKNLRINYLKKMD